VQRIAGNIPGNVCDEIIAKIYSTFEQFLSNGIYTEVHNKR